MRIAECGLRNVPIAECGMNEALQIDPANPQSEIRNLQLAREGKGAGEQGIADFRLEIADLKEHGRQKVEPEAKSRQSARSRTGKAGQKAASIADCGMSRFGISEFGLRNDQTETAEGRGMKPSRVRPVGERLQTEGRSEVCLHLGEERRPGVTEPPPDPRSGDRHELVESNNRGVFEPSVGELGVAGRDQKVSRGQGFDGNGRREIRHDEIRSGGLRG